MRDQIQSQAHLLASKDIAAYAAIQAVTPGNTDVPAVEQESDDDIAFREAKERGMTEDDRIYFRAQGYPV